MLRCESCWYWNEIFMWSMHGSMWACCNKMYHSPRNLMHEEFHKSQIPTNKRWRNLERQITQQTRPPTWHFDEYQYIWTHAEALSHGRHVISLTHIFVPYTEYTHKYNYAGINTSGKWLDPQLYSSKLFPHGITPHCDIRTLHKSKYIALIAVSIASNTSSDKLYQRMFDFCHASSNILSIWAWILSLNSFSA